MAHEWNHVAILSICPKQYRTAKSSRADNVIYVGPDRRAVWMDLRDIFLEENCEGTYTVHDVWVLSFDVYIDWDDSPPIDEETGEYITETEYGYWHGADERWDMLVDVISQDPRYLGPDNEGEMHEDDVIANVGWIAGEMLDEDAVLIGRDVRNLWQGPYVAWRAPLYNGVIEKTG